MRNNSLQLSYGLIYCLSFCLSVLFHLVIISTISVPLGYDSGDELHLGQKFLDLLILDLIKNVS